jgi:hypothetical protein
MIQIIFIFGYLLANGFSTESKEMNYINYHREFSQIEEFISNEQFVEAESKLDTLFANYEVKFAKDYLIAAQICILNGHKEKGLKFIGNALKKGVKFDCLKSLSLFKIKISQSEWNQIENEASQLNREYLKNINLELYQEFHRRFQQEQNAKQSERYKSIVYSNFSRIKETIGSIGFPGETLIGIDNQILAESLSDCDCGNSKIIVTLLHYDYPISEIGEEKLISEIEKGNLHPREFATIYNFEMNKVSVLYNQSSKKYDSLPIYNFNFPFGEKITDIEKVNSDRGKFGICRYDVDEKKIELSRKYGMKLEFDYK